MPTDTAPSRKRAADFALRAAAWSIALFGLLRLDRVEQQILLPLTQLQGKLAVALCGAPARPVAATLACSGADVIALCLGAILAYPARWRTRLAGAAAGLALILALNTLRIGTLGRVAASPALFQALHVYVWPVALSLAAAGYVFAWMRFAGRRRRAEGPQLPGPGTAPTSAGRREFRPTGRFAVIAALLLLLFTAAAPLYLESAGVLSVASFIARAAAAALRLLGVEARATANHLWTSRGGFLVTQECIATPLIPIYLAAVLAFGGTWRTRLPALLVAVPLFVGLGIARLLVVALPAFLAASPLTLIHAFFQVLLAGVLVALAARWRHPDPGRAARRALLGAGAGLGFFLLLGAAYGSSVLAAAGTLASGRPPADPQGAIALLPGFQVGLYLALWTAARVDLGWKRFLAGLALLALSQPPFLAALPLLQGRVGAPLLVQGVRAWAVAAPPLLVALLHRIRPDGVARPGRLR